MGKFPDFKQYCEAACVKAWGQPSKRSDKQLQWNAGDGYGARTLDLRKKVWYDRGAERGGSTLELVDFVKGRPQRELKGKVFFEVWREAFELGFVPIAPPAPDAGFPPIRATFPYHDETGALLFEVVRFETSEPDERFRQRQPDGKGGWVWSLKGVRRVLYGLPALIAAVKASQLVLLTEGEKDANTAMTLGYVATTAPGGINKWRASYDEFLRNADVVIVSDNDAQLKDLETGKLQFHEDGRPVLPGQDYAAKLAKRLARVAKRVRVIMFEGVKDLSEWVEAGHTRDELDALITQAPEQAKPAAGEKEEEDASAAAAPVDDDAELDRLARMGPLDYERTRKASADMLGIRAAMLDRLVQVKRVELGLIATDGKAGHAITFPAREPWPEPVDGAALLDDIVAAIQRYVILTEYSARVTALWVVHTFLLVIFMITPQLAIRSPVHRCGKTTLLDVIKRLVHRPLATSSISPASLFRVAEEFSPTWLIDEVGASLRENKELKQLVNSAHRRGGAAIRIVGDDHEPRQFNVFSAIAFALIGKLPEEVNDRAIVIDMKRRLRSEKIESFRAARVDLSGHLEVLARKAMRWAADHAEKVRDRDPKMPDGVYSREADKWEPLLAIADEAGGKWPERARAAAAGAVKADAADDDGLSLLECLLADIRAGTAKGGDMLVQETLDEVRNKVRYVTSAAMVAALVDLVGHPWAEFGKSGKPLSQHQLARLLKPLGIFTEKFGPKQDRTNGYDLAAFEDAFERYLGPRGVSRSDTRTPCDEIRTSAIFDSDTRGGGVRPEKCKKPNNDGTESECPSPQKENGQNAARGKNFDAVGSTPLDYGGPVVEVPDLGPDALDDHGAELGHVQNADPDPAELCAKCGNPGGNQVAFGTDGLFIRLHRECEDDWIEARMAEEGIWRA